MVTSTTHCSRAWNAGERNLPVVRFNAGIQPSALIVFFSTCHYNYSTKFTPKYNIYEFVTAVVMFPLPMTNIRGKCDTKRAFPLRSRHLKWDNSSIALQSSFRDWPSDRDELANALFYPAAASATCTAAALFLIVVPWLYSTTRNYRGGGLLVLRISLPQGREDILWPCSMHDGGFLQGDCVGPMRRKTLSNSSRTSSKFILVRQAL